MPIRLPGLFYQFAYLLLRVYGFIFRPRMRGVLCFVECEEKVLLVKHSYGSDEWRLPGGNMGDDESPEEAIRRELMEEVGVEATQLRLLKRKVYGRDRSSVNYFHAGVPSPQFEISSGEIQEARWVTYDELLRLLPLTERYIISRHFRKRG
jgi:8-oxo-dGTP diphosphatase